MIVHSNVGARVRLASVQLLALVALCAVSAVPSHALADGTSAPSLSNVILNRRIATIAFARTPTPAHRSGGSAPRFTSDRDARSAAPPWRSDPTFLFIASRFASVDRLLHYRQHGVDANAWGLMSRSKTFRVEYTVHL